ncbi:MAG: RidA family protein [Deltaproteobacteria bacterium]|nr:RidA family protein [Deltaproteobacteria bacterium]
MSKQTLINPPGTEKIYEKLQFSQAVRAGNTIWVSGQVGMDATGMAGDGIEEQARLAFQNLQHVLEAAGSSLDDIVEMVSFHTSMNGIRDFGKVKAEFITQDYPAWTAVGVTELALPQLLVEIKATAVMGSGQK